MKLKGLLLLLLILSIVIFGWLMGMQNNYLVTVNYLVAETQLKASVLMAIVFALGVLTSILVMSWYILSLKWRIKRLTKAHKKLTHQVSE